MELERYYHASTNRRRYIEKTFTGTPEEYEQALAKSSTLYVANINRDFKETRLWHLFGVCGPLRRVIVGVNKINLTPCEFAFVEYEKPEDAERAILLFKGMEVEGKPLAVDKDVGFTEGRQYGRGTMGGKMASDESRKRRAGMGRVYNC